MQTKRCTMQAFTRDLLREKYRAAAVIGWRNLSRTRWSGLLKLAEAQFVILSVVMGKLGIFSSNIGPMAARGFRVSAAKRPSVVCVKGSALAFFVRNVSARFFHQLLDKHNTPESA